MQATQFEFLVEEPSMEAFLDEVLPRFLLDRATYLIHVHQGKPDLLRKLNGRLAGYAAWLPETSRIVVVVDRDNDNCLDLKRDLEDAARRAGLGTRQSTGARDWRVVTRLAIEELEAWFFGDWEAVCQKYPRVPSTVPAKAAYRNPDAIAGGTCDALERILVRAGYFSEGLRKVEFARAVGKEFDYDRCVSPSFVRLFSAINEAVTQSDSDLFQPILISGQR